MKIQDIFNLPKNRGGYKLFNRIMNRYGIPKDDAKEIKKNIDNSSSGGGSSSDIEYYTFNINNVPESWADKLMLILRLISSYKYTYKPLGDSTEYMIAGSAQFLKCIEGSGGTTNIIAIAYTPIYVGENVLIMTLKHVFMNSELDVTDFDKVFTPITKEEFYDLNKWSLEDYN